MLHLSRLGIRNLATDDLVYSRGLKDYKENRIVSATWANGKKQYRIMVEDNFNYQVIIQVLDDGSFHHYCNCPDHAKEETACKHVVTALFFVLNYEERTFMDEPENPSDKTIFQIIEYFSNQEIALPKGETYTIKVTISLPEILREDSGKAFLTFHIGNRKFYKIQSIRKFIIDFYNQENIRLGKDFHYIHGVSKLDKHSKKIVDFLMEIYEIQKENDIKVLNKIFTRAQVSLSYNLLLRFLELFDNTSFRLELYGKAYEGVVYRETNPSIEYHISQVEDSIMMDYSGNSSVTPMTETGELLYMDHIIYCPNKRFIKNYAPFFNHLGGNREPLYFKGANKEKFLEVILPVINETFALSIQDKIKEKFITDELEAIVYLDREKTNILADLRFRYGSIEFSSFDNPGNDEYIVLRDALKEDSHIEALESYGFQPGKHGFVLDNNDKIYDFLTNSIHELAKECELYYSEAFKKIRITNAGDFKAGLKVSNGMDLLEMELDFDQVPKEELKDLLKSFRIKKKYYRLKNNNFINLEDSKIKDVWNILTQLNISFSEFNKPAIELPKSTALYLDKMFTNKDLHVDKNEEYIQLVQTILNPNIKEYHLPKQIQGTLRDYQISGFKWLRTLAENKLGGILADDMGLGKTLQAIVYMASMKEEKAANTFIIVCPSSLVYNWQDEIETFAPHLTSKVVIGTPKERKDSVTSKEKPDILITSYPLLRRDVKLYHNINFHTIFIDEAQYIKNPNSLNAKSVKFLKGHHRFALTGTPIENSLSELWSIFDFIMPSYLFNHNRFIKKFEKPILKEDEEALTDLNRRITPFILRRMKKDVLHELPDKLEEKIVTDMSSEQKKVYLSYMDNIRNEIYSEINDNGYEKSKIKILAALTRLRQICCHPATFLENYNGESGKLNLLMELIPEAIANGHRILVFSQFTSMLTIIKEKLEEEKISYFYLEGSTKAGDRNEYVKRFNGGEREVFLISLKAGGTGLNLVGADIVIHYDPWWNPAIEEQATDRAYRIGQDKPVHVIKLITKGTIEEKIYKLQKRKKELSDTVIQSKEVFLNSLTKEELEEIFQ